MTNNSSPSLKSSREYVASTSSGYSMLLLLLILVAIMGFAVLSRLNPGLMTAVVGVCSFLFILILKGFYVLQPNQAAVITLFGSYKGTDRATGLRWVWPWMSKSKLSARANNMISETIKVNDLRGNPIEMAAQVVWRVTDTAQALFDVDDYKAFVKVQIEAAVRTIGSRYPFDDFEHQEITLRGNNDQVKSELRMELINRLHVAGITVDECGFTHLAYASEIAGAMLRRQQAQAVVAARKTLVEGAVGMVEMALDMLSGKKIAELDVNRRAALVSNLMVVLCSERDTQPVVNAGMSQYRRKPRLSPLSCLTRASILPQDGWIAGSSPLGTRGRVPSGPQPQARMSTASPVRRAAAGSSGCAPPAASTALACTVSLSEPPNSTAGSSARAELRSLPSTLPGSVEECGFSPFLALLTSQQLAQKYPLTIDIAIGTHPGARVRWPGKRSPLVAPRLVESVSRFGYLLVSAPAGDLRPSVGATTCRGKTCQGHLGDRR